MRVKYRINRLEDSHTDTTLLMFSWLIIHTAIHLFHVLIIAPLNLKKIFRFFFINMHVCICICTCIYIYIYIYIYIGNKHIIYHITFLHAHTHTHTHTHTSHASLHTLTENRYRYSTLFSSSRARLTTKNAR